MTSVFPTNLPGYVYYHDPTIIDHKKSSMHFQDLKNNGELKDEKNFELPPELQSGETFEPDFVKLDKKVLRYYGYFKESVVEEELENARIRLLVICYYLLDDTISITDVKQVNSGIPQGPFLKKGKVPKNNLG